MSKLEKKYYVYFDSTLKLKQIYNVVKIKQNRTGVQIVGLVIVEFYANKGLMHGRRQFVVSNATL
jgi:hypothetical protein